MDCVKIEELLVDFIQNEIDPDLRERVKDHLKSCLLCSGKFEDYTKIDKLLDEELTPQPSPLILSRLSRIAREGVKGDRAPFWRWWSYSPIFIPVLGSALALLIWISYPKKDTDRYRVDTVYSDDAIAKKAPLPEGQVLFEPRQNALEDLGSKPESHSSRDPSSGPLETYVLGKAVEKEVAERAARLPASEPATGKKSATLDIIQSDKPLAESRENLIRSTTKQEAREESFGRAEGLASEKQLAHEEPAVLNNDEKNREAESYSFRASAYGERLNLALRQQSAGNCDASIETNIDLIATTPPPPDEIKEKAYLSLAECYEQRGDWENALVNYQILQRVSPNQASLADDKIESLRKQIKLIKSRQSHPSDQESK